MNYKTRNTITTIAILVLVAAVIVGTLAAMTKGFKDWAVFGGKRAETVTEETVPRVVRAASAAETSDEESGIAVMSDVGARASGQTVFVGNGATSVPNWSEFISIEQGNADIISRIESADTSYWHTIRPYFGESVTPSGEFGKENCAFVVLKSESSGFSSDPAEFLQAAQYFKTFYGIYTEEYRPLLWTLDETEWDTIFSDRDCYYVMACVVWGYPGGNSVAYVSDYNLINGSSIIPMKLPENPEKEGYTFVGWYLDSAFETPYDGAPIYGDTDLYAKFEINKYVVTYRSNGGSSCSPETVDWGTSAPEKVPEKEGYDFLGWYFADGTKYEGQLVKQDITLYGRWEIQVFTVTFKVDGSVYHTCEVEYGTTFAEVFAHEAELRNMALLNAAGQRTTKQGAITAAVEVDIAGMTAEEKSAAFLSAHMWLIWALIGIACAAVLSTVIASLVAHKRR